MVEYDLMGYSVVKTTTDKLEQMLNGFSEGWSVRQITHVGGRDWVIIAEQEFSNFEDKADYVRDIN